MTRSNQVVLTLAGIALFVSYLAVGADAPPNPYERIVVRNTFALKPVPPPAPPPEPPKPPAPKVTLTGITTILGSKIVLLKTQASGKPGEPAKDGSYMLGEGEGSDGIHVLEINDKAATAKVDCFGDVVTLELSLKPPSGGGGGPVPGAPPVTAGFAPPPQPGTYPSGGTPVTLGSPGAKPNIPQRQVRGNVNGTGAIGGQGSIGVPGANPAYNITPIQGQPNAQPSQTPAAAQNLSAEQAIIMMEVERERTKDAVAKGLMPPIPPTELTPPGSAGLPTPPTTPPTPTPKSR